MTANITTSTPSSSWIPTPGPPLMTSMGTEFSVKASRLWGCIYLPIPRQVPPPQDSGCDGHRPQASGCSITVPPNFSWKGHLVGGAPGDHTFTKTAPVQGPLVVQSSLENCFVLFFFKAFNIKKKEKICQNRAKNRVTLGMFTGDK